MKWSLSLNNLSLGGYSPAYWKSDYPSYGNSNQAGVMKNMDLTSPTYITQGKKLTTIAAVDQLVKGIFNRAISTSTTLGFGGTKLYQITPTAITTLRTIAGKSGEDVALYDKEYYYAYNTDIGKYDPYLNSFDDDWWTAVGLGEGLIDGATHQIEVAGENGVMWISDGYYIKEWDGATATNDAFDIPDTDVEIVSNRWAQNRLWIVANKPSRFKTTTWASPTATGIFYNDWTNPTDAYSSNDIYSTCNPAAANKFQDYYTFGFNIPTGATIRGIEVIVEGKVAATTGGYAIALSNDEGTSWDGYNGTFTTTDTQYTFGGKNSLWSLAWTPATVNLIRARIRADNGTDKTYSLDHIKIRVHYTIDETTGQKEGSLFTWDGTSSSWDTQLKINGEFGPVYIKEGIPFIFYKKNYSQGVCTLATTDGYQLKDLCHYKGSLPKFYQVCEYEDFIIWASGTDIFAFGSGESNLPARLFQFGVCGTGGLANPFGDPISATTTTISKLTANTTDAYWKSLCFNVISDGTKSMIDELKFQIEPMAATARLDWSLVDSAGTTLKTGEISYTTYTAETLIKFQPIIVTDEFRLEIDYANGSVSTLVKVKSIEILGHSIK